MEKIKELKEVLADLLFAYINKDDEFPHDFEYIAVEKTVKILLENKDFSKYSESFLKKSLKEIKEKALY